LVAERDGEDGGERQGRCGKQKVHGKTPNSGIGALSVEATLVLSMPGLIARWMPKRNGLHI
jgi:hypothetical protein